MIGFKAFAVLGMLALATRAPAVAQQATPPYGPPITLEQAKNVMAAAEAEAQKNNWPVAITVVDAGGFVVATSVRGNDGKLRALEVHFLTPTSNQGQSPY